MRFHIVGVGSVGSLVAHNLRTSLGQSHQVALIHKNFETALRAVEKENKIQLHLNGIQTHAVGFFPEELPPLNPKHAAGRTTESFVHTDHIDSLFVTTKAHHVLSAIRRLLPRLSINSTIVLLQNGMGILEELLVEVFKNPTRRPNFILASNTHGVYERSFFDIVHSGLGKIEFGIVPNSTTLKDFESGFKSKDHRGSLEDITADANAPDYERFRSLRNTVAALLLMESLQTTWKPIAQVELAMRRKLVVNSVINPLTALFGCRNGVIFDTPAAVNLRKFVCREASSIFAAQTKSNNLTWVSTLQEQGMDTSQVGLARIPTALTADSLQLECARIAELTERNISSMLADIRRGRPTEIDYMNGYLLSLGKTYGVRTPTIATLRDLIQMRSAIPLDH